MSKGLILLFLRIRRDCERTRIKNKKRKREKCVIQFHLAILHPSPLGTRFEDLMRLTVCQKPFIYSVFVAVKRVSDG